MKQKNRLEALNALIARTSDKDFDEREHAIFQLALILERSNLRDSSAPDIYSSNLDRHLIKLVLSETEQREVVDVLARLTITQQENRPSCYWAMGKARGVVLLPTLLVLLRAQGAQMDDESAYQAVIALQNCLSEGLSLPLVQHLKDNNPSFLLEKWARSKDRRLAMAAEKCQNMLQPLL